MEKICQGDAPIFFTRVGRVLPRPVSKTDSNINGTGGQQKKLGKGRGKEGDERKTEGREMGGKNERRAKGRSPRSDF